MIELSNGGNEKKTRGFLCLALNDSGVLMPGSPSVWSLWETLELKHRVLDAATKWSPQKAEPQRKLKCRGEEEG